MTAQWMCEVGRGKAKKMQLRLIRSPACITGKPEKPLLTQEPDGHWSLPSEAPRALSTARSRGACSRGGGSGARPRRRPPGPARPRSQFPNPTWEPGRRTVPLTLRGCTPLGTRGRDSGFSSALTSPRPNDSGSRTAPLSPAPAPRPGAGPRPGPPCQRARRAAARPGSVPACGAGGRCSSSLTCAGTLLRAASFRTPIPARAPNRAAKRSPHVWPRPAPPPAASPPGRQLPVWVRGKRVPLPVPPGPQRMWSVSAAEGEDGSTSGRPPQRRGRRAGCRSRSSCCGDDWGRGRWLQSPPSVSGCVGGGDVSGSCWKALGWRR